MLDWQPSALSHAPPQQSKSPASKRAKAPASLLSEAAQRAVALVDEAAQRLPPEDALRLSFMPEGAYVSRPADEPPLAGTRPAPRGHPDCLTGKTFVISGVLDSLRREEAEDLIRRHNGKVTGNVSGRTSFLVMGQHAGRSKHAAAKAKGTKIIDESGLFSLIAATQEEAEGLKKGEEALAVPVAPAAVQSKPAASGARSSVPPAPTATRALSKSDQSHQLWVEKWRPQATSELVGNPGHVATLRSWLQQWDDVHLRGREPSGGGGARGAYGRGPDLRKRAALISGPPGIGKTTAALCLCRELGLRAVEVNASDTRSKADASVLKGVAGKLSNSIKELSTNTAVSFRGGDPARGRERLCLVMDEVDGMSGGDRGGVADLIQTIKHSRVPIIAICNDKYSPKLRSLRNHCLELEFRK